MPTLSLRATYIGGPTALLEINGVRLLTDPTFDPAGSVYPTPAYKLEKTAAPAIDAESLRPIDVVLLSHDHHFDNLDRSGRKFLPHADRVLTTPAGAERLGGNAAGLVPWATVEVRAENGAAVRVTGTPARHGPEDGDRGPVTGFLIRHVRVPESARAPAIYVSGDTVMFEGLHPIAEHADVRVAFLFLGAARVAAAGPAHLTFTAEEGVKAARLFPDAVIVPLHHMGWKHFSEGRAEIERAFAEAGMTQRLRWLIPGNATEIAVP